MAEILGIDITVITSIAEIAMAVTTVILAYFTFQSVKVSRITLQSLKDQVDIAKKEFENKQIELEKPQIIDQIQEVLNPLNGKVDLELNQIEEKSFLWKSKTYRKASPLFQLKPSIDFYYESDITSRFGLKIHEISSNYPIFQKLCHNRYKIHLSIADVFTKIYKEIKTPNFDDEIGKLIYKKNLSHEVYTQSGCYLDDMVTLYDNDDEMAFVPHDIPINFFHMTIVNIRIAELLGQRIIPQGDYEQMIISEYSSYEKDMTVLLKPESFDEYSKVFHSLIEELKTTDIELKSEITKIKMEYREKYHLSDQEFWTIFQNTS